MKKTYKILIFVLILIIIIISLFFIFKKPDENLGDINEEENLGDLNTDESETNNEVDVNDVKIKVLSDEENNVFDFWFDNDSNEILYITNSGKIYSAKEGPDIEISSRELSSINKIRYNNLNDMVLVAFGNPKTPDWGVFDTKDRVWRPLPSYIYDAIWKDNDIYSIVFSNNGKSLVLFSMDNLQNNSEEYDVVINNFNFNDVNIEYIGDNNMLIKEKPSAFYKTNIWKLNTENSEVTYILNPENGLVLNYDNEIYFKYSYQNNNFRILNSELNIEFPNIFNTLPEKCTNEIDNIYCFVPNNFPNDYKLPDDYYKKRIYTLDSLYKINKELETTEEVINRLEGFNEYLDGIKPKLINNQLIFKNRYDERLYSIKIN